MIKVVIFDLDDTMISEASYIESGFKHIAKLFSSKYNLSEIEVLEVLFNLFEESTSNVFNRLYDAYHIEYNQHQVLELVQEYRMHIPDIRFFEDVIPLINILKSRGIRLGVITDGYAIGQKNKLEVLDASKYFEKIIITDEMGREYWKPHPKAFEMMEEYFKVSFEEMIYIGDNPEKDFYISHIYPIKTVRIKRDLAIYKNRSYHKGIKEQYLINNLLELLELL